VLEVAKINYIRLYPYGGGSNLALIQSLNRYSDHNGTVYTKTQLSQICSNCHTDFEKFKVKTATTVNLRIGINLVSFIRNFIIEDGTELMDLAEPTNGYSFQVTKTATKLNIPVVITSIETISHPFARIVPPLRIYANYIKHKATHFRVFTDKSKDYLEKLGIPPHKISKFPIGIDTDLFFPPPNKGEPDVKILFSRRLEQKNGILDLLRATKILNQKGYKLSLMIVGDGPLSQVVSSMSRFYPVRLFGQVSYHDLATIYRRADIYCNPAFDKEFMNMTYQEDGQYTFPLLESQASGLPLLTTQSGSNSEIVNYKNPIIPQHSLKALIDSLEYLMDMNIRREIGAENRKFILDNYDASRLQINSDRFYQGIIDRN